MSSPNVITYLNGLRPALPFSADRQCTPMSGKELRKHLDQGRVLFNGEPTRSDERIDFPVFSLVFFPKGNRRTTII